MNKLTALLIILFFNSCKPLALKLHGIKTKVHYVTKDEIKKYAVKHHFDTTDLFYNNLDILRLLRKGDKSANVFLLFNKSGDLLIDTVSGSCKGLRQQNFKSVLANQSYKIDSSLNFFSIRQNLLKHSPTREISTEDYNYFVILSWATYAGQLNKSNYKNLLQEIGKYTDLKIKIITVNLDFLKGEEYFPKKNKRSIKS